MDYLRTLGSAAVSSLVQKSGLNLPFTLGTRVTSSEIWTLYDGTKRDDGSLVSIFEYDLSDPSRKKFIPLAKNALRKLRTTRHPDVLKFIDAVETDTTIHIMTERVRPLSTTLPAWSSKAEREKEDWLLWGLHRISVALAFVNDPCASTHGNLRVSSIFISPSGEWKLGGFEAMSNPKDEAAVLYTMGSIIPDVSACASPEVKKGGWSVLKEHGTSVGDAYALGLLLHTIFNPSLPLPATAQPPHPPPQPSSRGSIPRSVFPSFKRLLNPNPKLRLSAKDFLEIGMSQTAGEAAGFFANNRLVKVCMGLDNFSLSDEAEKTTLLRTLKESAASFPPEFASYRVLPSLVLALEFGGASAATMLPLVLELGKNVSPEDYPSAVLAPLIKLFASPDRGMRMALLDHLPDYADKLDKKATVDKIWPHLQTGFADTVPIIREATVKSIILISPKLNDRILNNDLLRYLAKMQSDPEASIRTNTCILIGRLGPSLGYNTKRKVLVPAFTKALKDPFVHARVAGLMAFMASVECFEVEELATKVIPNVSPALIDKEKLVRDQAFKAIDLFVKRLESNSATMPVTVATEDTTHDETHISPPSNSTIIVNSAAGAAGALAGWAISSMTKTLGTTDMQSSISVTVIDQPTFTPGVSSNALRQGVSPLRSASPLVTSGSSPLIPSLAVPTVGSTTKSKGMQLGAHKIPANVASAALAAQLAEEAAAEDGTDANPWGTDDLIDINADQDDWSAFESAPAPLIVEPKPIPATTLGLNLKSSSVPLSRTQDTTAQTGLASLPLDNTFDPSQSMRTTLSTQPWKAAVPVRDTALSRSSSRMSTPISSPPPESGGWESVEKKATTMTSPTPSMAGMSKEEKIAEMARRKEERKLRIAQLKEQKKVAGTRT